MGWTLVGDWSYTGDPASSDRDAVRFIVGDTDDADKLVSDQEIDWALDNEATNDAAAARVAEHISARFAREADKSISASPGQSITTHLSQRAASFKSLAKQLRATSVAVVIPYMGGRTISDKDTLRDDDDAVKPAFGRDQFEAVRPDESRSWWWPT